MERARIPNKKPLDLGGLEAGLGQATRKGFARDSESEGEDEAGEEPAAEG